MAGNYETVNFIVYFSSCLYFVRCRLMGVRTPPSNWISPDNPENIKIKFFKKKRREKEEQHIININIFVEYINDA